MDELSEQQRTNIRKMSHDRLRSKLTQAGYNPEVLAQLERPVLIQEWAKVVAANPELKVDDYDVEVEEEEEEAHELEEAMARQGFEERRLVLEEKRIEEQRLQREEQRLQRELEQKKLEMQREQKELEQKKLELDEAKWRREMALKEQEFQFKCSQAERELTQKDSTAAKLKLWGDALRNTISKMPNEPVDVISWFICLERLYEQLKVPPELQAVLLRPYLSERAKSLLARCEVDKSADYAEIKKYLLQEMKLSPTVYLDKFSAASKDSAETYQQFSLRLLALFEFYVQGRKIESNYEKLLELIIYDRVKSALPPYLARHVLALEAGHSDQWLGRKKLVDSLDAYVASSSNAKPVGKPDYFPRTPKVTDKRPASSVTVTQSAESDPRKAQPVQSSWRSGGSSGGATKRCWICQGDHLRYECPHRGNQTSTGKGRTEQYTHRINTCKYRDCDRPKTSMKVKPEPIAADHTVARTQAAAIIEDVKQPSVQAEAQQLDVRKCDSEPALMDPILADGWSRLHFVDVNIAGLSREVAALNDSGAQICVIRADLIENLQLPVVGRASIRGVTDSVVNTDLVSLKMKLTQAKTYVSVTCAVCNTLSSELILGSDVVDRLQNQCLDDQEKSGSECITEPLGDVDCDVDDAVKCTPTTVHLTNDADISVNDDSVINGDAVDVAQNSKVGESLLTLPEADGESKSCNVAADELRKDQQNDKSLAICWSLARRGKGGYYTRDGILYRKESILGQDYEQLCLPRIRRPQVIKLSHETCGSHLGSRKTKARIKLSFTWPTIASDVTDACQKCHVCQKRRRVTVYDRVPISPVPRGDKVFDCFVMDCFGPLFPNQNVKYNYCLVLCDSCSRYPAAFALTSLTAKSVCNALLQLFQTTGIPSVIRCDCATNFTSQLTRTFLSMLGCSPRFNVPGRPQQTGLCERLIGTLKSMISKVAAEHPKSWYKHLGFILWALREVPNETTGVPPWLMVFGKLPRGPLAVLKETWCGQRDVPLSLGQTTTEYLKELKENLRIANSYAETHTQREQQRYISRYNLRSREKSFTIGEKVLLLVPDSTSSKTFSRWRGPGTVVERKSPHSYIVELDGSRRHLHADRLRKYHLQVDEIECNSYACLNASDQCHVNQCASMIYERDQDFGDVEVIDTTKKSDLLLPSQKIDPPKLAHLSEKQKRELLTVLDRFAECFSEKPGFCDLVQHEIHVTGEFKPRRLPAYRVPESLKAEVQRQIDEMLAMGIIKPSKSEMASPIVCVLKGKDGKDGVRLAIDYRYVNKYTVGDAYPMPDVNDLIQRIGQARYVSLFDAKGAYWQLGVRPDHQWLTAFVWDGGLYEFTRAPFGQKNSGNSFVRAVQQILYPIRDFVDSFVDDMAVHSTKWTQHLDHLEKYLHVIKQSGLTLNLKKCEFAKSEVKFVGHVIGSGQRRADPEKVKAVQLMTPPQNKRQVRQILGFFSFFRDYIPNFAEMAKPLSDLTSKRVSGRIPWGAVQNKAFNDLKDSLCRAVNQPLQVVDFNKPFTLHVDSSDHTVAAVCTQTAGDDLEKPVAFASAKLTLTQRAWSTIEKEAFAAIWALKRFRNWIFGKPVTLFTDHDPLTFLTEAAPKSAKLMRWALALQEYDVTFCYKKGKLNVAADCLSRMGQSDDNAGLPVATRITSTE